MEVLVTGSGDDYNHYDLVVEMLKKITSSRCFMETAWSLPYTTPGGLNKEDSYPPLPTGVRVLGSWYLGSLVSADVPARAYALGRPKFHPVYTNIEMMTW